MKHLSIRTLVFTLLVLFAGSALAEDNFEYWPGANYDPAIPTHMDILGFDAGDRIASPSEVIKFFEALQAAAPDRLKVFKYATSWEGRDLIYVVVTSPENMARIDDTKAGMQALADPRITNSAAAEPLINDLPGVNWLSYGVHGNEISSTDAAMMMAYHLLAAQDDELVTKAMNDTVTIIDPMQNPDGRDRFIHHFEQAEGLIEDPSPYSAEHIENWPSGRVNHYLFDLNRDWFAMTQPESQGKVAAVLEWFPLVFIDAHEMGSDASYYFAPQARPYNPHTTDEQIESLFDLGKNNAKWFDNFGFDYFTREVFDGFYPGYGDSWPKALGAVASTYEQASARSLKNTRYDGKVFHYRETVRQHFVASLSTAEFVADNREALLRQFYDYRVSAVSEGGSERIKSYIIPTQSDMAGVNKMVGVLAAQGIEVGEATASFRACGTTYQAGSYVINLAQPSKRAIRTLLDQNNPIAADFLALQEARRDNNLPAEIYDVTAWSLPLMYNVNVAACNSAVSSNLTVRGPETIRPGTFSGDNASVAYLVPWGTSASGRLLGQALLIGLDVLASDKAFTHDGTVYPGGSLIFKVEDNPADLGVRLADMAATTGANVTGVNSSWVTDGPNFGSFTTLSVPKVKVAILWDAPTNQYAAGNTRFVIERQLGYPVTALRVSTLRFADLSEYDVILMPPSSGFWGSYTPALAGGPLEALKTWINQGGTLVAMGNALNYVTDPKVGLLSISREDAFREDEPKPEMKPEDQKPTVPGTLIGSADELSSKIQPNREAPDFQPGVIVRATTDKEHWLAGGLADTLHVLVRGTDIYTPITLDKGVNVAYFAGADELLASGHMWEENKKQMAFKPFLVLQPTGRGYVVGITQDPTVRAYLDGLNAVLMNAIFRTATHANRN